MSSWSVPPRSNWRARRQRCCSKFSSAVLMRINMLVGRDDPGRYARPTNAKIYRFVSQTTVQPRCFEPSLLTSSSVRRSRCRSRCRRLLFQTITRSARPARNRRAAALRRSRHLGAIQHLAGARDSGDPSRSTRIRKHSIFQVADYGLVASTCSRSFRNFTAAVWAGSARQQQGEPG